MFDRQRRRQHGSCQPALTHLFSGRSTGVAGTYATLPAATEGCSASADRVFRLNVDWPFLHIWSHPVDPLPMLWRSARRFWRSFGCRGGRQPCSRGAQ